MTTPDTDTVWILPVSAALMTITCVIIIIIIMMTPSTEVCLLITGEAIFECLVEE